jgi:sugar-specific transcriptional regulator TrmB
MEEIVNQLIEYGLSRNEAKVVTFLAKRGAEKASVAARALRLNRTETYRTLRHLQHRGLIEASLDEPIRFQTAPFPRCLEMLLMEQKSKLAVLEERASALEHTFESLSIETAAPAFERFQVIEGRARIGQKLRFICENSKLQIDLMTSSSDLAGGSARAGMDVLSMLAKRGRKIRIVTNIDSDSVRFIEPFQTLIAFRHLDLTQKPVPRLSIIDDTEALLGTGGSEDTDGRGSEQVVLWISSRSFVRSLRAYFNQVWSGATPALARLETIKATKPE